MACRTSATVERFDDSFIVRTIRDFFVTLAIITGVMLAVRFAVMLWEYRTEEEVRTERAAEDLAADVTSIMVNRGGPVAARTVYPIIEENHERIGLDIAIEPSQTTVTSIEGLFDFTPEGVPADWHDGTHHEARVAIEAQEFCLQCHSQAEPGDVLGWVTVRNYRAEHIAIWLKDVWLSGLFGLGNIVISTVILFTLLRLRMEPLLSLRGIVSRMAKASADFSGRAPVRSKDEFGELAHDLNVFLDRLSDVFDDLSGLLAEVTENASHLHNANETLDACSFAMGDITNRLAQLSGEGAGDSGEPRDQALLAILESLETLLTQLRPGQQGQSRVRDLRDRLEEAMQARNRSGTVDGCVSEMDREVRTVARAVRETRLVEQRMRALSAQGRQLLERLGHAQDRSDVGQPSALSAD